MGKTISSAELAELLGPELTEIKAPAECRHPFKEYTYEELTNAPKKVYLCGDDDRPVLLSDALWQTMGLLKSAKTYFCMELGFCIAFGLDFHGLPTKGGNVAYIIAEGGIIALPAHDATRSHLAWFDNLAGWFRRLLIECDGMADDKAEDALMVAERSDFGCDVLATRGFHRSAQASEGQSES